MEEINEIKAMVEEVKTMLRGWLDEQHQEEEDRRPQFHLTKDDLRQLLSQMEAHGTDVIVITPKKPVKPEDDARIQLEKAAEKYKKEQEERRTEEASQLLQRKLKNSGE
jgi:hypothetical protein